MRQRTQEVSVFIGALALMSLKPLSRLKFDSATASLLQPNRCLAKLNTEAVPQPSAQFNIRSIPTMVLFRGGKEVARQSGAMGSADIVRRVQLQLS